MTRMWSAHVGRASWSDHETGARVPCYNLKGAAHLRCRGNQEME
jgi:hypothetical protein